MLSRRLFIPGLPHMLLFSSCSNSPFFHPSPFTPSSWGQRHSPNSSSPNTAAREFIAIHVVATAVKRRLTPETKVSSLHPLQMTCSSMQDLQKARSAKVNNAAGQESENGIKLLKMTQINWSYLAHFPSIVGALRYSSSFPSNKGPSHKT